MEFTGERFVPEVHGNIELEHLHRYLLACKVAAGKVVLDIASGEGYGSAMLAGIAHKVIGVDISQEAVSHAQAKYQASNLEFRLGSCSAIPLESASIDAVVSFETIEHHDEHDTMMQEIKRVLRPGGVLVISSPDKLEFSDAFGSTNAHHVKELYRDEFRKLLELYFKNHIIYGQKVVYGSAIFREDGVSPVESYELFDAAFPTIPGVPHAVYLVAVATDAEPPLLSSGLLEQRIEDTDFTHFWSKLMAERDGQIASLNQGVSERDGQIASLNQGVSERDGQIASLNQGVAERDGQIASLNQGVSERDGQIASLNQGVSERDGQIASLYQGVADVRRELQHILASKSWQLTKTLRFARRLVVSQPNRAVRRVVSDSSRALWRSLPFSFERKRKLKNFLFSTFPLVCRWSKAYQAWEGFNSPTTHYAVTNKELSAQVVKANDANVYVPLLAGKPLDVKPAKLICFYLPQFHAIPENDEWWGDGFTEWTNVEPAQPQFAGHYQPHIPGELGYYNLLDPVVQRRQVELAKLYGIHGFCFYFYWFGGKQLLQAPIENYLNDSSLNLPFCLCWANENWSRRWDGLDSEMLIAQQHSPHDDLAFIQQVSQYLHDPRYIRIDGKPLLLVYRPSLLPSAKKTASRWRDWCRKNGVGEIYLAYTQSFEMVNPAKYGFDAAIEFPPNNSAPPDITNSIAPFGKGYGGIVYDWQVFVERSEHYKQQPYTLFRGVCPSWDNTARRKNSGAVFLNNTPALFQRWLENAIRDTQANHSNPDERLIFVNAWNEWAEGAYLEPDQRYGYAWLQAVRQAQMAVAKKCQGKLLIVTHDAHPHGAQLLCLNMAKHFKIHLNFDVDMIVLGDGDLLPHFANYATVHRINLVDIGSTKLDATLGELKRKCVRTAIVNTTVSGLLVPHLKRHDFSIVSLVHELPGILTSYNLQQHAQAIADHSDKIVFATHEVKQGFEAFIGQSLQQAVIRPQGLYQRSWLRTGADKKLIRLQVRQQLGIPREAKIILCVGYADHRKGFDLFVQVLAQAMQRRQDVYALWVGHTDKNFVDASMVHADALGLRSRFLFTGLVDEPQPYYLAADIYALTSREDPFPSVVMEAFDALTPVVAFEGCGGFEELLNRGCGELAPKEDIDSFSSLILALLDNAQHSFQMAQMGRDIVERELNFRHYLFDLLRFGDQPTLRVSAIVPNYNYAPYLHDRLATVTAQTLPLYELIVLDDCSTDDSLGVIQSCLVQCDVPCQLDVNETNSGSVFKQWRKGVKLARGEYIWIAEADDICKPQFVERVVSRMREVGAVLGFADSWQIDEAGGLLGKSYKAYANEDFPGAFDHSFVMEGRDFLAKHLGIKNVILNVSGVIFRRDVLLEALDKLGDDLFRYKVAGDWRLYIELCASNGKIVYEAEPLNGHRRHKKSVTHALEVKGHIQEIENMHTVSNALLSTSQFKGAQKAYRAHVKNYLNEKV